MKKLTKTQKERRLTSIARREEKALRRGDTRTLNNLVFQAQRILFVL